MTRQFSDRLRYILNHTWLNLHIVYTVSSFQNIKNVRLVQQLLSFVASKTFKNKRLVYSISIIQNVCNVSIVYSVQNVQNISIVCVTYLKWVLHSALRKSSISFIYKNFIEGPSNQLAWLTFIKLIIITRKFVVIKEWLRKDLEQIKSCFVNVIRLYVRSFSLNLS